jgi:hypothetical protein
MHKLALACACLLLLGLPASSASAARAICQAPPGRSGIDEYCEVLPGATGNRGPGGNERSGGPGLSPRTQRELSRAGKPGRVLLELSRGAGLSPRAGSERGQQQRSGGQGRAGRRSHSQPAGGGRSQPAGSGRAAPTAPDSNPLSAVRSAVQSGDSAGLGFIWALLVLVVLFAGVAWLRYRSRERPE